MRNIDKSDTIFGVPIDFFYRDLSDPEINAVRPRRKFKVRSIIKSLFLIFQIRHYQRIICIPDRTDLIEKAQTLKTCDSVILISRENALNLNIEYVDASIFDILRIFLRIIFLPLSIFFIFRYVRNRRFDRKIKIYLNACHKIFSDTIYNYIMTLILKGEVYYAIATLPGVEKFQNLHQSIEIQHGIIHRLHHGYIGLPPVHNTLMVDSIFYMHKLHSMGYEGRILVNREYEALKYKKVPDKELLDTITVFTQPGEAYSNLFKEVIKLLNKHKIDYTVRRHPLDTTKYEICETKELDLTTALKSSVGIFATSTLIEDFLINRRTAFVVKPTQLSEKYWYNFREHFEELGKYLEVQPTFFEEVGELIDAC